MRKNKIIVLSVFLLCACSNYDEKRSSNMKSPVIIIGIDKGRDGTDCAIAIKDANGEIMYSNNTGFARALSNRNVGDTIK